MWSTAFLRSRVAATKSATTSMPSSVQHSLGPMALHGTSFRASTDTKSVDEKPSWFQLGDAIGIAAARSGFSHKQLCAHMDGLDAGTWSKQLQGDGHISLTRLLKCPPAFWDEFLPLLCAHFGIAATSSNGVSQSVARCLIAMADVIGRLELVSDSNQKVSGL
jgi:hypothetical protein